MSAELYQLLIGIWIGFTGAAVGSFLNVVIYRLPHDLSIVKPRSRCPNCERSIAWYDNIPIISFIILGAKCRHCKSKISIRYPLVEILSAFIALALWCKFGLSKELAVHFVFSAALIAVTFIDIDWRIIPNEISLPGILIGFGCSFLWAGFWQESLIGLVVGGGGLLLLSLSYSLIRGREGMGMGDVKLLAMLGAWLGWKSLLFILLFASLQGLVITVIMVIFGVKLKPPLPEDWEEEKETSPEQNQEEVEATFLSAAIPFGPFLAVSAVEYLFLAEWFYSFLRAGY
jgi:leader peptidase (prepilin peptidase)/N-methyltransferase